MEIRTALDEDAAGACQVIRRSVTELCISDHRNDPTILSKWLSNKTPEIFASWTRHPSNSVIVAIEGGVILGVGAVTDAGDINLNYVSPDARFRGVSREMLRALEARAGEQGNVRCTLTSTETARRFYRDRGYIEEAARLERFGIFGYPMWRSLGAETSEAR
jgi:GNAT superfamily N-acetyltransferase